MTTREVILRVVRRRRCSAHEVVPVLARVGVAVGVGVVYKHLRKLEREGLAASERVRTGRAGNRRREYWAV